MDQITYSVFTMSTILEYYMELLPGGRGKTLH